MSRRTKAQFLWTTNAFMKTCYVHVTAKWDQKVNKGIVILNLSVHKEGLCPVQRGAQDSFGNSAADDLFHIFFKTKYRYLLYIIIHYICNFIWKQITRIKRISSITCRDRLKLGEYILTWVQHSTSKHTPAWKIICQTSCDFRWDKCYRSFIVDLKMKYKLL